MKKKKRINVKKKRIKKSVMLDRRISAFISLILFIFNFFLYNEIKVYEQNPTSLSIFATVIFIVTLIVNVVFLFMLFYANTDRYIKNMYLKPIETNKKKKELWYL